MAVAGKNRRSDAVAAIVDPDQMAHVIPAGITDPGYNGLTKKKALGTSASTLLVREDRSGRNIRRVEGKSVTAGLQRFQ